MDETSGCWLWQGGVDSCGYGQIGEVVDGKPITWKTHRLGYILEVGPIPDGWAIDHLCQARRCWNPHHLETVTPSVNALRQIERNGHVNSNKTHCKHGHEFTDENTWRDKNGGRNCRTCNRERARARYTSRKST